MKRITNSSELLHSWKKEPIFAPSNNKYMMYFETFILLIGIIAVLVITNVVLLWRYLHGQQELRQKNDVIVREIRKNIELHNLLSQKLGAK